jgi:3-deoxy-manno-octulosonate cytidylyltransferase (CMP-KDO synthetase)
MSAFAVVIPARYASVRLPGKALREINGKPLLQHVYERGCESAADTVIVATDDARIAAVGEAFGATVCMTAAQHHSGTERIAEVADIMDWDDSTIVVNLQGDEPTMPAALIDQCAQLLSEGGVDIATLASPFESQEDFQNPNCVKVVCDEQGRALYFSRAGIPYARGEETRQLARESALHHHGIYAYRCGVVRQLVAAPASPLEVSEQLEQLRALSLGLTIKVGVPQQRPGIGVDTEDDLQRAAQELLVRQL